MQWYVSIIGWGGGEFHHYLSDCRMSSGGGGGGCNCVYFLNRQVTIISINTTDVFAVTTGGTATIPLSSWNRRNNSGCHRGYHRG